MRTTCSTRLVALAWLGLATACAETPTEPQDPDAELLSAFETLAVEANRLGDADGAAALGGGSIALRMGVRPSSIELTINGEVIRHHALVAGITREIDGESRMVRTLFAWTGDRRPETLLEVTLRSNEGEFGPDVADPAKRARGIYANLRERLRWFATGGGATITVAGIGEACGRPLSENPNIECVKARFDVRMVGEFHRRSPDGATVVSESRLSITTVADGVKGVVVGPAGQ